MADRHTTMMAGIAGAVAAGCAFAPRSFLRLFGIDEDEVNGATRLALGLVATRNAYLAAHALRGQPAAKAAFLPVQLLDQAVFWRALITKAIPRSGALLAISVSGAIIAIDVARRRDVDAAER